LQIFAAKKFLPKSSPRSAVLNERDRLGSGADLALTWLEPEAAFA
jgi:hypothetical protein